MNNGSRPKPPLAPAAHAGSNKWLVLAAIGLGIFLSVLDSSIVNVSLPIITEELNTDLTTIQWVVMAYLLTITGLLLTFGRLADLLGRKPVYVAGMALFTVAMTLCGLAQTVEQLIALRVAQGIGAAMVMALGPALTASAFPQHERGKALGINGTIVAVGAICGPIFGGLLTDLFDWRWVFLFRAPLGAVATIFAVKTIADAPGEGRRRFDLLGGALLFLWLAALTLGLNQGRNLGWDSPATLTLFAVALVGLVLFIAIERRVAEPMLELSIFRNRLFSAASFSSLLSFMANFAVAFLMPFYFLQAQGIPPREAGLMLLPQPLVMSVVAPLSGSLSDRMGSRFLSSLGLAIAAVSLFGLGMLRVDSTYPEIALRLAGIGLGVGMFQSPNNSALLSSVPPAMMGVASGMLATMRNLGMVLGTAVAGAVWTGRMAFHTHELTQAGNLSAEAVQSQAFIGGIQDAFMVSAAICSIGVLTSLVRGSQQPRPAAGPPPRVMARSEPRHEA